MNRFKRFLYRLKIMNVKTNYELVYYELLNENRPRSSLMPWKTYLLGYLRKHNIKS